jgi:hypothetical protein
MLKRKALSFCLEGYLIHESFFSQVNSVKFNQSKIFILTTQTMFFVALVVNSGLQKYHILL